MTTGEKILFAVLFTMALVGTMVLTALRLGAAEPRVSIRLHHTTIGDSIECHVPIDSLNRYLDILIEEVSGEQRDLRDQNISSYVMEITRLLSCPWREGPTEEHVGVV